MELHLAWNHLSSSWFYWWVLTLLTVWCLVIFSHYHTNTSTGLGFGAASLFQWWMKIFTKSPRQSLTRTHFSELSLGNTLLGSVRVTVPVRERHFVGVNVRVGLKTVTTAQILKPWQQLKDVTEQMCQVKRRVSISESHKMMLNDQDKSVCFFHSCPC